jgi:hypothetical protein
MINLNEVKQQINESIPWRDGVLTVEQARALVAEVERLREEAVVARSNETWLTVEIEQLRAQVADCAQGYRFAADKAKTRERAAVVAFMRATPEVEFDELPQRIECGEHRKEQP